MNKPEKKHCILNTNYYLRVGRRKTLTSHTVVTVQESVREHPDTRRAKFLLGRVKPKEIIIGVVENREKNSKG